jgi:hypothetical protein
MAWPDIHEHYPHLLHLNDLLYWLSWHPKMGCLLDVKQNSKLLIEKIAAGIKGRNLYGQVFLTAPSIKMPLAGLHADSSLLLYAQSLDPRIKVHVIDVLPFFLLRTAREFRADIISFGWLNDSALSQIVFETLFFKKIYRQILKNNSDLKIFGGITSGKTRYDDIFRVFNLLRCRDDVRHLYHCTQGLLDGIITDDPEDTMEYLKKL